MQALTQKTYELRAEHDKALAVEIANAVARMLNGK